MEIKDLQNRVENHSKEWAYWGQESNSQTKWEMQHRNRKYKKVLSRNQRDEAYNN